MYASIRNVGRVAIAATFTIALAAGTGGASASQDSGSQQEAAAERPLLKVPFPCGQSWRGATYDYHKPLRAIDLNMGGGDDDLGKPVKASAAGTVATANYVGDGYGERIIISHGGGWQTHYAHLQRNSSTVKAGDKVTANTTIGKVGKTGGQATSHLHYEQILNGAVVDIRFGTSTWVPYYATAYYERSRC